MKLGLIARADNSGLGNQTWELYRHLQPEKTLVVDVSHLHDYAAHCNKQTFLSRYPDATVYRDWVPDTKLIHDWMQGLDVIMTCETPYNPNLFLLARRSGIKTVLQYNWEMLGNLNVPTMPHPDLYVAPSSWYYSQFPWNNVTYLPVPIATDRFPVKERKFTDQVKFLHVVGRPAVHDRNGTYDLTEALQFCEKDVDLTIVTQDHSFLPENYELPSNVKVTLDHNDRDNYWELYEGFDVLVMPRRYGGLCLPMNEALGAGMPVIMPDISPNNAVLPANWLVPAVKTGAFRSKSDIDLYNVKSRALASTIDRFTSPYVWEIGHQEALRLAQSLSWQELKPRYDQIFKNLMEGKYEDHHPDKAVARR